MEESLKNIMYQVNRLSLAFEDYTDNTGNYDVLQINEAFDKLKKFRNSKNALSEKEQKEFLNKILDKFNESLDIVGRDKFVFYDDGDINYIWNYSLLKNKKDKVEKYWLYNILNLNFKMLFLQIITKIYNHYIVILYRY